MMNSKKQDTKNTSHNEETITFECITNNENVVKAVSYHEGKKQEVFFYVMPEDQFEALIPASAKNV